MIKIDVTGIQRFSADVTKLSASVRDVTPILKLVGLLGVRAVQRNFDEQRSPAGVAWAPLKTRSGQALMDTRVMRNGISFDLPRPRTVRIGASALTKSRNAIHNFGGKSGRGLKTTIPQREYMGFSAAAQAEILRSVRVQVVALLKVGR